MKKIVENLKDHILSTVIYPNDYVFCVDNGYIGICLNEFVGDDGKLKVSIIYPSKDPYYDAYKLYVREKEMYIAIDKYLFDIIDSIPNEVVDRLLLLVGGHSENSQYKYRVVHDLLDEFENYINQDISKYQKFLYQYTLGVNHTVYRFKGKNLRIVELNDGQLWLVKRKKYTKTNRRRNIRKHNIKEDNKYDIWDSTRYIFLKPIKYFNENGTKTKEAIKDILALVKREQFV